MQIVQEINYSQDVEIEAIDAGKELVSRELALIKIKLDKPNTIREIIDYISIFRGCVVDVSASSVIVEVTGKRNKINAFIDLIKENRILEIARTGIALSRDKDLKIRNNSRF